MLAVGTGEHSGEPTLQCHPFAAHSVEKQACFVLVKDLRHLRCDSCCVCYLAQTTCHGVGTFEYAFTYASAFTVDLWSVQC
jgi:hypothetical protein